MPKQNLSGRHILILDDTWTTGSNTQSAALTLRHAGADHVSVMVVGRWLSHTYGNNAEFIKTRLRRDYDPGVCPVTGGQCP
jgi:orotate phosphoribosyltransferase